jgi:hypothetical protein
MEDELELEDLEEQETQEQPDDTVAKKAADAEKCRAHEAAETQRKAEWDAQQQAKKDAEKKAIADLAAMRDSEVTGASVKRIGDDLERLTRRNMKQSVTQYVQSLCKCDPALARLTMHPRKSMLHCFRYINRMAREYLEQEAKDNDEKPVGGIGGDVPDGLCFQWAVDYFRDPDAQEDANKEEKFVPKQYYGGGSASKPKKKEKAKPKPEPEKPPEPPAPATGQISFEGLVTA